MPRPRILGRGIQSFFPKELIAQFPRTPVRPEPRNQRLPSLIVAATDPGSPPTKVQGNQNNGSDLKQREDIILALRPDYGNHYCKTHEPERYFDVSTTSTRKLGSCDNFFIGRPQLFPIPVIHANGHMSNVR